LRCKIGVTQLIIRFLTLALLSVVLVFALALLPATLESERDLGILDPDVLSKAGADSLLKLSEKARKDLIDREYLALRENPLDRTAHRNLVLLSLNAANSAATSEIVLNLSEYSLRNPAIQMAAMGQLIAANKLGDTLYRFDAVLRAHPTLAEQLYPLIGQHFNSKEGIKLLAEKLATAPPWRGQLLTHLSSNATTEKLSMDVIQALTTTKAPASDAELGQMFYAWIKLSNSYDNAYFAWLDQLSTDELRLAKGVYDGDFVSKRKNILFSWNFPPKRNTLSKIVLKPGSGSESALLVEFSGNKERFNHVFQYLRLAPGRYELGFDVMSKKLEAEQGLVWRVWCVEKRAKLAESVAFKIPTPWTRHAVSFEVKNENCSTQVLQLETKATAGLDTTVNGSIYFDAFVVK
jgi:hypothetical protein